MRFIPDPPATLTASSFEFPRRRFLIAIPLPGAHGSAATARHAAIRAAAGSRHSEEIYDSNEKTRAEDDHRAGIGSDGMVGGRANATARRGKSWCAAKECLPDSKDGLSSEGRPLPGGREVDLWSLWPEMLVYALLEFNIGSPEVGMART